MKQLMIKVAIGIFLIFSGWKLTDKGLSSPSEEYLAEFETLCKQSVKTIGMLDSTYTQTNYKIVKGSSGTKLNDFTYSFKVNDKIFRDHYSAFEEVPDKLIIDVWYVPSNPDSHSLVEPCKQLEISKSKQFPKWVLYLSIPMLLIGLGLAYGSFKNIIRLAIQSNAK